MRTPSSGIALEGLPCIGITAFSALIFALIGCPPMAVIFLALAFFSLHFFRDPERVTPAEAGIAVSPADGKVTKTTLAPDPFSGDMRPCVSIFMNVFNVHVNRSPVESTVTGIAYHPGKFINAALDKASADNERCAYKLEDADKNEWSMVQIAGLIARRIVCRAEQGDALERGERFGMIRFGSRVDLYLPEGYEPAVAPGDRTVAGETVVARKKA